MTPNPGRLLLSLVFIFISTIHICAQTPTATATVAGRVTLNGAPVRGATVALQPDQVNFRLDLKAILRAQTDESGGFRFERVAAGRYILGAIAPGYVAPSDNQYGPQGKALNLSAGETTDDIEIKLKPGGVITGRVTDAQGNPVVGEGLELSQLNQQGKPERLFLGPNGNMYATDDRGIYRLFGIPAGRYLISIGFEQRPNSITITSRRVFYGRTFYPDATDEARAKIIEVSEGKETTGIDIVVGGLKKNYDVTGRVVYEGEQPAVAANVNYGAINEQSKRVGAWGSRGEVTNAQGEFRLQNVLPGKYGAFASIENDEDVFSETTPFEISDGDVTGIEIKLRRGGSLSGSAVLEGSHDPSIAAKLTQIQLSVSLATPELAAPNTRDTAKIAANGGFRFGGLRAGKAKISIASNAQGRGFAVLGVERGGVAQRDGIDIGAGEHITGVRVMLGYGSGQVRGQLQMAGGLPATVYLMARARRVDSGTMAGSASQIDPRGLFRIESLPPGEYEVYLSSYHRSSDPPLGYAALVEQLINIKQRVTVSNDAEASVTLTLDLNRKEGNQ